MGKNKGIRQARADKDLLARAVPSDYLDAAEVLEEVGTSVPLARSLPVQLAAALCREKGREGIPVVVDQDAPKAPDLGIPE